MGERELVQAKALVQAAVLVAAFAGATSAYAHPGYPPIVDSTLGVKVEAWAPTQGCQLCHTDSSGGSSLRPFGQRMVSTYGLDSNASTEDDNSLVIALKGLQSGDPSLVSDLQKGIDPNGDVPNDPLPQYGCSAAGTRGDVRGDGRGQGPAGGTAGGVVAMGLIAAAFIARARRLRAR
jgi:hypothetical protein